jgi:hypothetical protein
MSPIELSLMTRIFLGFRAIARQSNDFLGPDMRWKFVTKAVSLLYARFWAVDSVIVGFVLDRGNCDGTTR